jgi:hypothetical protein
MDLGQPGNGKNDAIGNAKRNGKTEVPSLLERFKMNPDQTRSEIRKELGWFEEMAAEIFALVVFLCDGLLEIRKENMSGTARFMRMAKRLSMELQMALSFRVVGSMRLNISGRVCEAAFVALAKLCSPN